MRPARFTNRNQSSRLPLRKPAEGIGKRRISITDQGEEVTEIKRAGEVEYDSQDLLDGEDAARVSASKRSKFSSPPSRAEGMETDGEDYDGHESENEENDEGAEVVLTSMESGEKKKAITLKLSNNYSLFTHEQPVSKDDGTSTFSCVAIERRPKSTEKKGMRFSFPLRRLSHVCEALNTIKSPLIQQGELNSTKISKMCPDHNGIIHLDRHAVYDRRRFKIDNISIQARTEHYKSAKGYPTAYEALTFSRDCGKDKDGKEKVFSFSLPIELLSTVSAGANYILSERK